MPVIPNHSVLICATRILINYIQKNHSSESFGNFFFHLLFCFVSFSFEETFPEFTRAHTIKLGEEEEDEESVKSFNK